jgi:hypothetical protein
VGGRRKDIQMLDSDTLAARGFVVAPGLIDPAECRALAALWPETPRFRSHVVMQRHGFGQGEYQYFAYPLPERIEALRQALYPELAAVANRWNAELGVAKRFPTSLQAWLRQCHAGGQKRPTPLLLRYGPGDYNCLHRDLYGELVFPLQATVLLSDPAKDFSGGEVVPLKQGDAVIFAVNERPVKGSRGFYRTAMRHGVSSLREGERFTLGIIFHDAA